MNQTPDIPITVDTSHVELPEELKAVAEQMAEHVHEVWVAARVAQGWTYGPERNDADKKHPCLIPYAQLPEEEKAYDRETSTETLKFLMVSGFEIVPKHQ
ncbi:MAG: Ryanodine receptor Ryr [Bacteroidales bacterium]|nr:Ryanodine receptor Ryr [Bacteroidales bacterium]